MAKNLEDVIKALPAEDAEAVSTALSTVKAEVEAEKTKGINSYKDAKSETNRLLNKFKPIEKALQEAGLDLNDEGLADAIKAAKSNQSGKSELEKSLATLQRQVKDLTESNAEKEKQAQESAAKLRQKMISEKLTKAFDGKLIDGVTDYIIRTMTLDGKVRVTDDDGIVFVENGEEISFDKGLENWMKTNKPLLRNTQKSGGGSSGGRGERQPESPTMTTEEFKKLPTKEQALFILPKSKGGKGGTLDT